jgi:transglutaminase-like putative cysteine protease
VNLEECGRAIQNEKPSKCSTLYCHYTVVSRADRIAVDRGILRNIANSFQLRGGNMNRYHLVHTTEFHYDGPVSESYNEVRLRPMTDEWQSCPSFLLMTTPASISNSYQDAFGNWVHQFNVLQRHRHLTIETDSMVLSLDAPKIAAETTLAQVDAAQEELHEEFYDYLIDSKYVPHLEELDELIATAELNSDGTAFRFAEAASLLIHKRFQYVKGATHVRSSIVDALRLKAGVCQDFAHLLLGAARKRGVPARYVSGYLVPRRANNTNFALEEVIGGLASHAWVEVYIPGSGWMALDPTLGDTVGPGHVRVAYGRDYGDVPPVRGLYNGNAGQRLSVEVQLLPAMDENRLEPPNATAALSAEETTTAHICPGNCGGCDSRCRWRRA